MAADQRYELFGWDYEAVSTFSDEEVGWYTLWAERTGGPLLGLACGTGRLLCRLAQAGFDVTGADLSDTMLTLARKKVASLSTDAQQRIRLVKADMADFDLHQQFNLVFIADNSFRELNTRKDLLRCLRCTKKHMAPKGKLLITERRLDPSLYPNGTRSFGWSEPIPHPHTGELISRRGEIRVAKDHKRISGRFIYSTTHPDGTETIQECLWSAPLLSKQDYVRLFDRAGFDVQLFVGYEQTRDDGKDPLLCFVCESRSN